MAEYRRIPHVVEAVQWLDDEDSTILLIELFGRVTQADRTKCSMRGYEGHVHIVSNNREYMVYTGDFIILNDNNRLSIMNQKKFEETYEPTKFSNFVASLSQHMQDAVPEIKRMFSSDEEPIKPYQIVVPIKRTPK